MMGLRRNILIFHNAALGDFVMTWPVALALGRVFAQSRVRYVTSGQKGALAEKAIGIEFLDSDAGWHALHGDGTAVAPHVERALGGLQLGVIFSAKPDTGFERRLREQAGECAMVWINPNSPTGEPVWANQLNELEKVPMLRQAVEQMQRLIQTRGLQSPPGEAKSIVVHPGSGAARKNWPIEHFLSLATLLKTQGYAVTVALGEVERERFAKDSIDRLSQVAAVRWCETATELYDLIAGADGFVGNDSGPTHLAAMLGRRVVALFGPTSDEVAWRPMGPRVEVVSFDATPAQVAAKISG